MTRQNLLLLLTPCTAHSQYKNCFQAFVWSAPSDCILWQQEMGKSKTKLSYCWQISPKSESQLGPWEEGGIVLWLPRETVSPNYVLTISFEMIRKKLRSPLWRWDRYSYEEGLMAPLDAKGSFIPGYSFSSIHSSDYDKFASKFQPKCLSPYSIQPKDSRTFWRTTAWTSCQEVAQTCE